MKTIKKNVTVTTITADGVKVVDNKTVIETLPTATVCYEMDIDTFISHAKAIEV